MPKTPAEMIAAIVANIPKRTGRNVDEWVRLIHKEGPPLFNDRLEWLKREHGMGSVTAKVLADKASGGSWSREYEDVDALVETLYSGPRKALRSIYDQIIQLAVRLGDDVKVSPRKTYTSLIRNRQFAIIKPAGHKQIDVGLILPGVPPRGRLQPEAVAGMTDRITHHLEVKSVMEIDREVDSWLRKAYEGDRPKRA